MKMEMEWEKIKMGKNLWKWKTHIKFTCRNDRMLEIKSFPFPFSLNSHQNEIKSKWNPKWNKTMEMKFFPFTVMTVTYSTSISIKTNRIFGDFSQNF